MSDMLIANECISHFVVRSTVSAGVSSIVRDNFEQYIMNGLQNKGKKIRFVFPAEAVNCHDMFREFVLDHSTIGDSVADAVINKISNVLSDESVFMITESVTFEAKYTTTDSADFMFIFSIDIRESAMVYKDFVSVVSDEKHKRMRKLGYNEFAVNKLKS